MNNIQKGQKVQKDTSTGKDGVGQYTDHKATIVAL